MDMETFNKTWEVDYIKSRIEDVYSAVENGNYESAIDMLHMIQDKAEDFINNILK